MNFGVRLPGPFRVGINSRGKMNMGVTMGPLSVSTGGGGGGRTTSRLEKRVTHLPYRSAAEAAEAMRREGWKVTDGQTVAGFRQYVANRGRKTVLIVDEPDGPAISFRATSNWTVLALTVIILGVLAWIYYT